MPELTKYYDLLILCARAPKAPSPLGSIPSDMLREGRGSALSEAEVVRDYNHLRQAAEAIPSWDSLPYLAEIHGLAPLVFRHLRAAEIVIPESARLALQARAIQRSHANRVRTRALVEILAAFEAEGIDLLVLKGMATAHLVYPQAGLRPMSDIDLLVSKTDAQRGQTLLAELGFQAAMPGESEPAFAHRHMPMVERQVEGMPLCIELHHALGFDQLPANEFEALRPAAIPLGLDGIQAFTLSATDLLAHTYYHMFDAPQHRPNLIWIADMISLVEQFHDRIDWDRLPSQVYNALATIDWLVPFEGLPQIKGTRSSVPLSPDERVAHLRGWPFSVSSSQDLIENAFKTLLPSTWWLRLYYGLSPDRSLLGVRAFHLLRLFWWGIRIRGLSHIARRGVEYLTGWRE